MLWPYSCVAAAEAIFDVLLQWAVESGVPDCVADRLVRSNTLTMEPINQAVSPALAVPPLRRAKFAIGQVVKHRIYPFRGVIFDVDPVFANTEEWLASIPEEVRPRRDQPFYHLLAENAQTTYVAYVSEQNLLPDDTGKPVSHPQVPQFFKELKRGHYVSRERSLH